MFQGLIDTEGAWDLQAGGKGLCRAGKNGANGPFLWGVDTTTCS